MASSGMLRSVALLITEVSEERSSSIIRVARNVELLTKLAVTSNLSALYVLRIVLFLRSVSRLLVTADAAPRSSVLVTLMMETILSFETSVLTRATRRNNPEDTILHSHRRENFKSYIALTDWTL
jgi:hypothetical protein